MNPFGVSDLIHSGEVYDYVNAFDFDLAFYKKWCQQKGGEVLELCSGTGRLTIPLASAGVKITGIDISTSMLDRARAKACQQNQNITFHQADISKLELDKKFDLIFIPFNSLQCIYSISDVEKVFTGVRKHLRSNGIFIFDVFNPSIDIMVARRDRWTLVTEFVMENGQRVKIDEQCLYDAAHQVNRVTWRYQIEEKESFHQLDMRCFYPLEMDALLKYNSFKIIHKFGDFEENVFRAESAKQIYICRL